MFLTHLKCTQIYIYILEHLKFLFFLAHIQPEALSRQAFRAAAPWFHKALLSRNFEFTKIKKGDFKEVLLFLLSYLSVEILIGEKKKKA